MTEVYDLNAALAAVDRYGRRRALAAARRLYGLTTMAVRTSSRDLDLTQVGHELEACLLAVSLAAHERAVQLYAARRREFALSEKQVRALLREANKPEKEALRKLYGSMAKALTDQTMSKVRDKLMSVTAALADKRPRDYRKQVRAAMRSLGVDDERDHMVQTATRTQASLAFNAAAWQESDDDELWGYEYVTAGDERVRASHRALDGVRYPRDHKFWEKYAPLNGWNCRCGLNPIYRGEKRARVKPYRGTPDIDPAFLFNPGKIFAS